MVLERSRVIFLLILGRAPIAPLRLLRIQIFNRSAGVRESYKKQTLFTFSVESRQRQNIRFVSPACSLCGMAASGSSAFPSE